MGAAGDLGHNGVHGRREEERVAETPRPWIAAVWRSTLPDRNSQCCRAGEERETEGPDTYMWTSFLGTISLSLPTSARPVARTRFSPLAVRGISVLPVCLPLSDHSVSPWRTMKTLGADMAASAPSS